MKFDNSRFSHSTDMIGAPYPLSGVFVIQG